jgi:phage-related protein
LGFEPRSLENIIFAKTGYQIDRVQNGLEPDNFKPMTTVGTSVYEIRVEDQSGAFRVIYIAKFEQCVYVLHAFVKKTTKTSKQDIELAAGRYKALMKQRGTK